MTETTTGEQIEIWKKELVIAIAEQQWQLALKLCSWIRYALWQQGLSDPEVEEAHRQAKEALADQAAMDKPQKDGEERHLRLKALAMSQIISGNWSQALDSIEALYQVGTNSHELIILLQKLKERSTTLLSPQFQQLDPQVETLSRRLDELMERIDHDLKKGSKH